MGAHAIATAGRRAKPFWSYVLLVVAFLLRVYNLSGQSLWNDEGTSVALSSLSLPAILSGAAHDIHPPLYYFLLHFWMPLAGQTEFSVRFLSVAAGVLVVAATFATAALWFGQRVGTLAALLCACSPIQIYYSQETRMYIWVTLWAAVSAYVFSRTVCVLQGKRQKAKLKSEKANGQSQDPESKTEGSNSEYRIVNSDSPLLPFVFLLLPCTLAAMYTHYFGLTVLLFENLAFAVWLTVNARTQRSAVVGAKKETLHLKRAVALWLVFDTLAAVAYLPWYLFAGGQLATWPAISEPFDLPTLLWRSLHAFSVGLTLEGSTAAMSTVAFGLLFVIGLLPGRQARANWGRAIVLLWVLTPIGAMYAISLSRPAYDPKLLLLATPAFLVLVASGLARLAQATIGATERLRLGVTRLAYASGVMAIVVLIPAVPSLRNYYSDAHFARDDYRSIVRYIDSAERPGDGILVDAPGQIDVVRYYRRGGQPFFLLPRMRPPEPVATRADVDQMLERVQRLYAIYWATDQSDPQRIVESRLAENAYKARDTWYGNIRLAIYGAEPRLMQEQNVRARFSNEITLESDELVQGTLRGGDIAAIALHWRADIVPSGRYKVFVHLLDAQGQVVAQRDGEPMADLRPTSTWRPGETITDRYGILIEPGIPPGDYQIELGMYRPEDGSRLTIMGANGQAQGDSLILGSIHVTE